MSAIQIQKPDGDFIWAQADADGNLKTTGSGGGGGGGDATAANQTTQIGLETSTRNAVQSIDGKVATETKQDAGNASLVSIDGKLGSTLTVQFDGTQSVNVAAINTTPTQPVQTAQLRQPKTYTSIPVGGIDTTTEIPGYPFPASGYWAYDGTHLDVRGILDPTLVEQLPGSGYWDNIVIGRIEDTSDVTSFTLYWR
jgi:hypothetical protein